MTTAPDLARPQLLEGLRDLVSRRPELELVLLFGSRARERGSQRSDVDLAFEGDGVDVLGLILDIRDALGLEADLVDLRRVGYPLRKAILRDGVVVHEGSRHAGARWRTRAMLECEDERPGYELTRNAFLARLAEQA